MILSAQSIRFLCRSRDLIVPFHERSTYNGLTYGLSPAGYDIRIDGSVTLPSGGFALSSSMEQFNMPNDLLARVTDKSTWARKGLCVQNTVIEPGWRGFLTLELTNHSPFPIEIPGCSPIAQILFETLDYPTEQPYGGKYQDQRSGPVPAIMWVWFPCTQ